jgi:hypothetical protein
VRFPESDLAAMAAAEEVDIETRSSAGEAHRAIIWIVAQEGDVYVRSYRGPRGRWYREALADPEVAVHVDGRRIPATAVPATDPTSVEACSEGLRAKYPRSQSLAAMLIPEVLPTTLKLVPA